MLPGLEEDALRGMAPISTSPISADEFETASRTIVPTLLCPERGGEELVRVSPEFKFALGDEIDKCARTDFAINGGSKFCELAHGPTSIREGDDGNYQWPSMNAFNGISYIRSRISSGKVRDGHSHVVLLGERWASIDLMDEGFNQPMCSGDSLELRRSTQMPPAKDGSLSGSSMTFGSSRMEGAGISFCDGSVRVLAYDVDAMVFEKLGGRDDGGSSIE